MVELACAVVHFVFISPIFACFSTASYAGLELLCTCQFKLLHVQDLPVYMDVAVVSGSGNCVLLLRQLLTLK